jgi:hypothetical protein
MIEKPRVLTRGFFLLQRFRHQNAVALSSGLQWLGSVELVCSRLHISMFAVERRQLGSQAEDGDVHELTSALAAILFGSLNH